MKNYVYHVRHKNGWGTGCGPHPTECHTCGAALPVQSGETCSTGYGCGKAEKIDMRAYLIETHTAIAAAPVLKEGETLERSPAVCYTCCAEGDRKTMRETGRITLYLSKGADEKYTVGNWPGSMKFGVYGLTRGRHNIARVRYDFGFTFEGEAWRGTQYGDNTQIAHCRRVKG